MLEMTLEDVEEANNPVDAMSPLPLQPSVDPVEVAGVQGGAVAAETDHLVRGDAVLLALGVQGVRTNLGFLSRIIRPSFARNKVANKLVSWLGDHDVDILHAILAEDPPVNLLPDEALVVGTVVVDAGNVLGLRVSLLHRLRLDFLHRTPDLLSGNQHGCVARSHEACGN